MTNVHIAMWSGPRTLSTALMRSFENRFDTFVSDEPLYAQFLNQTGADHPLREKIIEFSNTNLESIVKYLTAKIPQGKNYQKSSRVQREPQTDRAQDPPEPRHNKVQVERGCLAQAVL